MVMFATLVVFQRDLDSIAMLVGQVRRLARPYVRGQHEDSLTRTLARFCSQLANEVLNQILKRTIRQSRPHGARMSGSGMPSAHSQFIAFFAAYVVAYTLKRCF